MQTGMPPQTKRLAKGSSMHAAGIFADMTVDGPEIGTLVVIVDRAKNLPNRKSMGKQDPYCNCRLAKEAKKTKTDKRGGQVPKWDEELRFTVRDSPDYYQLKVSIFNDDKKTELIGEAFVDLNDVIKPGGGQNDPWQSLNCKGKYAGEVKLEMTYYDSRPKPERSAEEMAMDSVRDAPGSVKGSRHQTPVKRRPLPSDPISQGGSPADHGRPLPPAGGPRELGTPSRALAQPQGRSAGNTPNSNRRTVYNNNQPQPVEPRPVSQQHYYPDTPDDPFVQEPHYSPSQHDAYSSYGGYEPNPPPQPQHQEYQYQDNPITGLPELPPMTNHRRQGSNRPQQDPYQTEYGQPTPPRQPELHHAHSAPQVAPHAPYPEDMLHPRETFQHTQSDPYMNHGQPARQEYEDPYQQPRDPYVPPHQEREVSPSYQYQNQPRAVSPAPVHEGYSHVPPTSIYRRPSEQYEQQPLNHYQLDAPPPPPPVHRDSAPNSARRESSYSSFAPAPLNVTPLRRSPSPLPFHEPEQYSTPQHYDAPSEYGGRRNTAPENSSPQEPHIYRPRALSGEAMRNLNRPVSREEQYALPPSHPDYYSPTTGTPPEFPDTRTTAPARRESYQPPYQPAQRSPLATESPHSFRDDKSSLPSQANTPSRGSDLFQQPLPTRSHPTPPRPYANHHYTSSEPYIPPANYQTPPRQHPLSQQVATGSSPNSYHHPTPPQDQVAIARPIALSAHATPASEPRQSRAVDRTTPTTRKSLSPRPPLSDRPPSTHFDPDSFNRFNPAASSSTSSLLNHPALSSHGSTPAKDVPYTQDGKIVDFHGNHIDPSDRLPETSWAPEPEPKGNTKDKPFRERERIGGARDLNVTIAAKTSPRVSTGENESPTAAVSGGSGGGVVIRARLRKKERPSSALVMSTNTTQDRPFRDIPNPPGASPNDYSPSSHWSSPLNSGMKGSPNAYGGGSPGGYGDDRYYGGGGARAPPIPAKIPIAQDRYAAGHMNDDMAALSREINGIDIGPGSGRARVARGRLIGYHG